MNVFKNLYKNLLFTAILVSFSSGVSFCAKLNTSADKHALTLTELTREGNVSILNTTNIDLFISFLPATTGNTTPIFERMLPSMSFTAAMLDEKERLQTLTISILAKPKKLSKKQSTDCYPVTFLLDPRSIAGLDEIRLEVEDEQLIAYLSYNFTNFHTCSICQEKFEISAKIIILECGHVLNHECFEKCFASYGVSGNDCTKCPACDRRINQQESLIKLVKYKTRLVLYPISRLLNTDQKRSLKPCNFSAASIRNTKKH